MANNRIESIDGVKGLCGIWVVLAHYLMAFAGFGFIGFECGIAPADKAEYYFQYFPYSILTNGSWPLYIFFAIISFIPALRFFQNGTTDHIQRQITVRYFRLFFPAAGSILFALLVWKSCGFFNQPVAEILNNNWDRAFYNLTPTLWDALTRAVYTAPFLGDDDYCSVLWCLHLILYGSFFSYLVIWGTGMLKRRYFVYAALFLLTFAAPLYTAFLAGIVAADIIVLLNKKNIVLPAWASVLLLIAGFAIGNYPEVWLSNITVYTLYGIGSFAVLIPCCNSPWLQKILSIPFLKKAGEYSFTLILTHFTVMFSFSAWLFIKLHNCGVSYGWKLAIVFLTAIPVNILVGVLFRHLIEKPAGKLTDWIYRKLASD